MAKNSTNKCTRERITDALTAHGLTGHETVDMAGWLAGLRDLPHLDALTLGEAQHVMGRIDNATDVSGLIREWRAARVLEGVIPTPEQLRLEVIGWIF